MGERRGTKALELWCRRITEGYPGVNVQNMTTSWRDGLAFCAMIHHFRPDLIDFDSLDKEDIYGNNELAFRIAEQHLGIPALLDAEDMASCAVPDRLSILTYLSQFYQTFGGSSPSHVERRNAEGASEKISPVAESAPTKAMGRAGIRRELCAGCGLPVFLAEKLVISRSAYHRKCFRCARCRNQLTPGNYYETEKNEFCCEACPEEEPSVLNVSSSSMGSNLDGPLSDEEKSSLTLRKVEADDAGTRFIFDEMEGLSVVDGTSETEEIEPRDTAISYDNVDNVDEVLDNLRDTKEVPAGRPLSLVQKRLRMFECRGAENPKSEIRDDSAEPLESRDSSKAPREEAEPLSEVGESKIVESSDAEDYPELLNPFNDEESLPQPAKRSHSGKKRVLEAPKISLNPFWSDEEGPDSDEGVSDVAKSVSTPVPKPRTIRQTLGTRGSDIYASNASLASSSSTPGGTSRKKKPAPPPPISSEELAAMSPNSSGLSTTLSPRARKTKPAPLPPIFFEPDLASSDNEKLAKDPSVWTDEKLNKDEANRNRQSKSENAYTAIFPDKSAEGKWKRKKGPAPPRPIPHRRKIKVMSIKDLKLELDEIEMQQQGLEKQGVRLEQIIREKCESGIPSESVAVKIKIDVEELVLELFALVNEKNELFRRQAELMLLRRQYRLEEEHADIEYQIRCLMCQPEATKTDCDKQREEALIQRLIEIVERRNEIIECFEMDRRREVEEDRSIHKHMGLFAAKNKGEALGDNNQPVGGQKAKKNKLKGKLKEKKAKKGQKEDADKDIDEVERKSKRHTKRKWF